MKQAFNIVRQLLMSIPLGIVWMLMLTFLYLGWGDSSVWAFIRHWNNFVEEGPFSLGEDSNDQ